MHNLHTNLILLTYFYIALSLISLWVLLLYLVDTCNNPNNTFLCLCNFIFLKKLREGQEYMYIVCYINLIICHFRWFSFLPVYLITFWYHSLTPKWLSSHTLPLSIFFQIYYISIHYGPKNIITYIWLMQ